MSNTYRIAHLTDLHAAATWQPVVDAMAAITLAVPALGMATKFVSQTMKHLPPNIGFTSKAMMGLAGAAGGAWVVSRSHIARSMTKIILTMMYQYNHSGASRRRRLFQSLRDHQVDHLIITGDFSITSHPDEFSKVCSELEEFGFDRSNTTVMPGNHDRIQFPRSCSFETVFPEITFPDVREIIPGVIIAGVDSNKSGNSWSIWETITANTRGYLDRKQLDKLELKLDGVTDESVVMGVHHLPVKRRKLKHIPEFMRKTYCDEPENADELRRLIKKHDALVLCGHDHPKHSRIVQFDGLKFFQGKASGLRFQHETNYEMYDVVPGKQITRLSATAS